MMTTISPSSPAMAFTTSLSGPADGEQIIRGTHQYGSQMTDPSSEHYLDQAEAFANETLHAPGFRVANRTTPNSPLYCLFVGVPLTRVVTYKPGV